MYKHFRPGYGNGPCWHCRFFAGIDSSGLAALCSSGPVRSMPHNGCAFWEREPGVDDEPGAPIAFRSRAMIAVNGSGVTAERNEAGNHERSKSARFFSCS